MKDLFAVAHPDDIEVMLAHAVAESADPYAAVVSDGEASTVDMRGYGFCPARQT